jgi:hypothetical protein
MLRSINRGQRDNGKLITPALSWKPMTSKQLNPRCKALAKSGETCRAVATAGGLCFFHAIPTKLLSWAE